jgi:hypothetical protein
MGSAMMIVIQGSSRWSPCQIHQAKSCFVTPRYCYFAPTCVKDWERGGRQVGEETGTVMRISEGVEAPRQ